MEMLSFSLSCRALLRLSLTFLTDCLLSGVRLRRLRFSFVFISLVLLFCCQILLPVVTRLVIYGERVLFSAKTGSASARLRYIESSGMLNLHRISLVFSDGSLKSAVLSSSNHLSPSNAYELCIFSFLLLYEYLH